MNKKYVNYVPAGTTFWMESSDHKGVYIKCHIETEPHATTGMQDFLLFYRQGERSEAMASHINIYAWWKNRLFGIYVGAEDG